MNKQAITSAKTSRNQVSKAINIVLEKKLIPSGSTVLDYGGGKFDKGIEKFKENSINSFVYDPYNRSKTHNSKIADSYDYAICANVLNVIAEQEIREFVISDIMTHTNTCFVCVYEGDKTGLGKATRDGWQNNQRSLFYINEIKQLGYKVFTKYGLIIVQK